MTRVQTHRSPELRQLFGAYLNADSAAVYGSVTNALAAYRHETGPGHRAAARPEFDRLTAAPGAAIGLSGDLATFGCGGASDEPGRGVGARREHPPRARDRRAVDEKPRRERGLHGSANENRI